LGLWLSASVSCGCPAWNSSHTLYLSRWRSSFVAPPASMTMLEFDRFCPLPWPTLLSF
jgi:hypothetical protein